MIQSKRDFHAYCDADCRSLGLKPRTLGLLFDDVYIFQMRMRKLEYAINCGKNPIRTFCRKILFRKSSVKLGFSISPNTFGPGLSIAHRGTIVVNGGARIGANCRIHVDVNIGTEAGKSDAAPIIGDNCYLGPGAKIFGPIEIGSGTVIGANAVVNKSFPEGDQTLGGIPAKVISQKNSESLLIKGHIL